MTTEMDLLDMDERQRLAWMKANRLTLMAVGLVWIGMIVDELAAGRTPVFLLAMIPAFAALRFALYLCFKRV